MLVVIKIFPKRLRQFQILYHQSTEFFMEFHEKLQTVKVQVNLEVLV